VAVFHQLDDEALMGGGQTQKPPAMRLGAIDRGMHPGNAVWKELAEQVASIPALLQIMLLAA
jgi:hypothetical protein